MNIPTTHTASLQLRPVDPTAATATSDTKATPGARGIQIRRRSSSPSSWVLRTWCAVGSGPVGPAALLAIAIGLCSLLPGRADAATQRFKSAKSSLFRQYRDAQSPPGQSLLPLTPTVVTQHVEHHIRSAREYRALRDDFRRYARYVFGGDILRKLEGTPSFQMLLLEKRLLPRAAQRIAAIERIKAAPPSDRLLALFVALWDRETSAKVREKLKDSLVELLLNLRIRLLSTVKRNNQLLRTRRSLRKTEGSLLKEHNALLRTSNKMVRLRIKLVQEIKKLQRAPRKTATTGR